MTRNRTRILALAAIVAVILPAAIASAQSSPFPTEQPPFASSPSTDGTVTGNVRETARARVELLASQDKIRPGDEFFLAAHWQLKKDDLHAYGNDHNATIEGVALGEPTRVEPLAPESFTFDRPVYPVSKAVEDEALGLTLREYFGQFTVLIPVRAPAQLDGQTVTFRVRTMYQVCDENSCYESYGQDSEPLELSMPVAKTGDEVADTHPEIFNAFTAAPPPSEQTPSQPETATPPPSKESPTPAEAEPSFEIFGFTFTTADWPLALAASILVGLALNLTPCVLPIIPLTVGFFVYQSQQGEDGRRRRGTILASGLGFAVGLVTTFLVLGGIVLAFRESFNVVFRHPEVQFGLGLFIIAMALGMFGLYPIQLPPSIAKLAGGRSGLGGAVLMGVIAAILSTPCTGPFLSGMIGLALTVPTAIGLALFVGMGLGMSLPYLVLTAAPGLLDHTPRSGRWTEMVKIALGFLLLAMGISLLSNLQPHRFSFAMMAALVMSAGIWLAASVIRPKSPTDSSGIGHWAARLILLAAVVGGVVMLWPAPRSADGHYGDLVFREYSDAVLAEAVAENQPVMIDLVSVGCANCVRMEKHVWPSPQAARALEGITPVRANTSYPPADQLHERFGIAGQGTPALVLLNGDGEVVATFTGIAFHSDPAAFAQAMRPVREQLGLAN